MERSISALSTATFTRYISAVECGQFTSTPDAARFSESSPADKTQILWIARGCASRMKHDKDMCRMKLFITVFATLSIVLVTAPMPVSAADRQGDRPATSTSQKVDGKNDKGKTLERAEQVLRDPSLLNGIKTIAVVPIVIQLGFDRDKRLPSPARMRARIASAELIPSLIDELGKSTKYSFVPVDAVTRAMADLGWVPTDLYVARRGATWNAPAEIVKGGKKDEADLLDKRDEMKRTPSELSLYRYRLHDVAEPTIGLASFKRGVFAQPDASKTKELAAKLGVDALLFVQVTDMEVHESLTGAGQLVDIFVGPFGQRRKSTRIHLQGTLVNASNSATVWQARGRGIKSKETSLFHAGGVKSELNKRALEGTEDAVRILLSDLCDGTGTPQK